MKLTDNEIRNIRLAQITFKKIKNSYCLAK